MKRVGNKLLICFLLVTLNTSLLADWPNWGGGPDHTFSIKGSLPMDLKLNWKRQLDTPTPAWPKSQDQLQFDDSHGVVISKGLVLVNSAVTDSVTAYTLADGKEKWTFRTDGPVRFSPAISKDRVYFGSDDGYLYCIDLLTGKEIWRLRGGLDDRKLIGNDRFISMWPVRGAPVVKDDIVYFAAGLFPFMGVFIHAVDAKTGDRIWLNSGDGSKYVSQPHTSPAFGSLAPQGYVAVTDDIVLVPCGRSVPAAFDRKTGKFVYFNHGSQKLEKRQGGGYDIRVGKNHFTTWISVCTLSDGERALTMKDKKETVVAIDDEALYSVLKGRLKATSIPVKDGLRKDRKGKTEDNFTYKTIWSKDAGFEKLFCKIGDHFIGVGKDNELLVFNKASDKMEWSHKLSSAPKHIAYTQGNLVVSTDTGMVYSFSTQGAGVEHKLIQPAAIKKTAHPIVDAAIKQLKRTSNAYALLVLPDPDMVAALVTSTDLAVVVLESDKANVDALRKQFAPGRVEIIHGQPGTIATPAYLADLIICGKRAEPILKQPAIAKRLINSIRPYGGIALLPAGVEASVKTILTVNETSTKQAASLIVSRPGALKGSASWTHQNADAANSMMSKDSLVKLPLGLLWFGGPSNDDVLPRHGHGPSPQVTEGRLFIEGPEMIRAVDVYTGRMLWQKEINKVGKYYNITAHAAGAGEIGGNYVCASDAIYIITPGSCLKLDPATGNTDATFTLPDGAKWGSINVIDDYLVVSGFPVINSSTPKSKKKKNEVVDEYADYSSASKMLYVLNRKTGAIIWKRPAVISYRHNSIIATGDKVFCLDSVSEKNKAFIKRRGLTSKSTPTLYALSIKDGSVIWKDDKNVFGTWLSYSTKHDVLFQGSSAGRDRARDEVGEGMAVFKAATGDLLWKSDRRYDGPVMLHHEKIITQGTAVELLTGKDWTTIDPITRVPKIWKFTRNYGCNMAIGSENFLFFRSAAAGYYDLEKDSGTGNFGGFKSSCTANLIAAGGVLNAPDYTRTCVCGYQLQTSLALVHMPDVETWTFNDRRQTAVVETPKGTSAKQIKEDIKHLALNFGAPGDRMTDDGILWLEWPFQGGPVPTTRNMKFGSTPKIVQTFCQHSALVKGSHPLKWVAASGITGMNNLKYDLRSIGTYTIKLLFPNQKVKPFDVSLNGKSLLTSFSPSSESSNDGIVIKTFKGIAINRNLELTFSKGEPVISGLEIILE